MDKKYLEDYKNQLPEISDDELINILKKRDYYESEAAELAVKEAIRRGIINSEHDLIGAKFRIKPMKFNFFPIIEKSNARKKIIRSMSRAILLIGLIPAIFGILKFTEDKLFEAIILLILGGIWLAGSVMLMRKNHKKYINIIMLMAIISTFYSIQLFLRMNNFRLMDLFITIILYSVIFYIIIYLKLLITGKRG